MKNLFVALKKRFKKMSATGMIMLGFLSIILIGTLILMTPFASRDGNTTPFIDAIFTATSATCVTGLVIADTYQKWNLLGQLVIITLIQIGGIGFMTIGVYIATLLKIRIGLKDRETLQESVSSIEVGGVVRLSQKIIKGTFIIEGIGTLLLAITFIPERGVIKGLYYGFFHAVSAFCNAGFDLMGDIQAYTSLVPYVGNILVNVVIMMLIIVGGIGFIVWDDILVHKNQFKKYILHTKIVLTMTMGLLIIGAILFYLLERNNLMVDMTFTEKILASLFSSVTPRTAGFNTIDTAGLSNGSKLLSMIFMYIGGSPGSTAGGIKTTTVLVLFCFAWRTIRNTQTTNVYGRRIEDDVLRKAISIVVINFMLAITATMIIFATQDLQFEDVLFEAFSAIGTVGMTTGITRELEPLSKILITTLMFFGRVGSLSFAITFGQKKVSAPIKLPAEKIVVG